MKKIITISIILVIAITGLLYIFFLPEPLTIVEGDERFLGTWNYTSTDSTIYFEENDYGWAHLVFETDYEISFTWTVENNQLYIISHIGGEEYFIDYNFIDNNTLNMNFMGIGGDCHTLVRE